MSSPHRKRIKERQRGRHAAEAAWDALEAGDPLRAERLMRRTLKGHEDDCVLWNDLGVILWKGEKLREAEKALRNAQLVNPLYEEAKMNLAALLASRGFYRQALRLEEEMASGGSPRRDYHEKKMAEYRAEIDKLGQGEGDTDMEAERSEAKGLEKPPVSMEKEEPPDSADS